MKVHEPRSMFLRVHVGEATDPNTGEKYQMSLVNGHTPAIESMSTGKTFIIDWSDILKLAIEQGVSK